jgi:enoyl-[acyl-carrier protein] reductase/trans-2-enoyl-CoA reductase (NAD+)
MKEKGTHEGCIEQMERLFAERLYVRVAADGSSVVPVDADNLIRIDDYELDPVVQNEVNRRLSLVTEENLGDLADLAGYRHDFLAASGFDVSGVDYEAELSRLDRI